MLSNSPCVFHLWHQTSSGWSFHSSCLIFHSRGNQSHMCALISISHVPLQRLPHSPQLTDSKTLSLYTVCGHAAAIRKKTSLFSVCDASVHRHSCVMVKLMFHKEDVNFYPKKESVLSPFLSFLKSVKTFGNSARRLWVHTYIVFAFVLRSTSLKTCALYGGWVCAGSVGR